MNKTVTSREAILAASQKLVMEKGLQAVNMRTVASVCGVAVGSVYNYFPSKAELLTATVEKCLERNFPYARRFCSVSEFCGQCCMGV